MRACYRTPSSFPRFEAPAVRQSAVAFGCVEQVRRLRTGSRIAIGAEAVKRMDTLESPDGEIPADGRNLSDVRVKPAI